MKKSRGVRRKKSNRMVILLTVLLVIAVVLAVVFNVWRNSRSEQKKIDRGIAYLDGLEKQDMTAINERIEAIRAERNRKLLESDENAVWTGFDGAVILGDSRAVGFYYFEFLPEQQVFAESGRKVTDVTENMEQLKALNPNRVYLSFGLNDIKSELWPEPADYAAAYGEILDLLKQELPACSIYVNSILPAIGDGLAGYERFNRIGEFNEALKTMAGEKGCGYIDNDTVAQEHMDLFEQDGLHLQKEFYRYWAANMLTGVKAE